MFSMVDAPVCGLVGLDRHVSLSLQNRCGLSEAFCHCKGPRSCKVAIDPGHDISS